MNQREKEEYLREYGILKSKGKPFFPYAVAKDAAMACVVMAVIITLSLVLGAELGSRVNAATHELRRAPGVVLLLPVRCPADHQAAEPRAAGDDRRADDLAMILLFLLPFYDRGPERRPERRPIATLTGIFVIGAMAYLTYQGAHAGTPDALEIATPKAVVANGPAAVARCERGASGGRPVWLRGVPYDRRQRQHRPRAEPHAHRFALPRLGIARTLVNPTAPMPSFKNLPPEKFKAVVEFLSS